MAACETDSARRAVRVRCSAEGARDDQAAPDPSLRPVLKTIHGETAPVVAIDDLVSMKRAANRDRDRMRMRSLDAAGLTAPAVERTLPEERRARLSHVRATE